MAGWQLALVTRLAIEQLRQSNEEARRAFVDRYEQGIFPHPGTSTAQTKWKTYRDIIRVTLWGRDHFRNNVRLAMVREAMGLGPRIYCIIRSLYPAFSERVFLLTQFLPHQKMYFYPFFGLPLRGPFNQSSHTREIAIAISQRIISHAERPNMCPACDSCFCDHAMEGLANL